MEWNGKQKPTLANVRGEDGPVGGEDGHFGGEDGAAPMEQSSGSGANVLSFFSEECAGSKRLMRHNKANNLLK